ncbi:hypothetical protein [Pararhodobacter zhoushanensis]|uniref:hypothetical protein n=1 Tax=Pararhodobacter zhoushanensis TaxID=2479545 RepID=UPI000F8F3D5C|nr:hypothetical protein [Pararhodobacter zhoushanensis]
MKRVRIVAIAAVALGAAVTAGTKFQQSRELSLAEPAVPSLTSASVVPAPTGTAPSLAALSSEAPAPVVELAQAPEAAEAILPADVAETPSLMGAQAPTQAPAAPVTAQAGTQPDMDLSRASILPSIDGAPAPVAADTQSDTQSFADTLPVAEADNPVLLSDLSPAQTPVADDVLPLDPELQAELAACAVWLVVTPAPGAMLDASVYAPCDNGAAVSVTHAGLSFDSRVGDDGQMMLQLPALSSEATVSVTFADGRVQTDSTTVPDLASMERVVLQWQGPAMLVLNAYEFGAAYGDPGHVNANAPREPGVPDQGFMTVLGDPDIEGAHLAQVYSYPRGETPRTGQVSLEIEAPITPTSCGQTLQANTVELHGTASAQVRQVQITMPDCDGTGGFIVLPGVLPELEIALN